jgi:hypothetical protein
MTMERTTERIIHLQRARREAQRGFPHLSYGLFHRALELTSEPPDQALLLHEMLDLCEEYFEKDSAPLARTARALLELTDNTDDRALAVLGTAYGFQARAARRRGDGETAWQRAQQAEASLVRSTELAPFNAEVWGTLGGLRKRLATWAREEDRPEAKGYAEASLQAYREGGLATADAYCLLNYVEQRAVRDQGLRSSTSGAEHSLWGANDEVLVARLDEALRIRQRQFHRGEDRPWPAFDLARGQHYLRPNVPRLLHDLEVALEEARQVARTASDRWMVETTIRSLDELHQAQPDLEGLDEGLLLLRRGVEDDRWLAGNWGPLGRPPDYLTQELSEVTSHLRETLDQIDGSQHAELHQQLCQFIGQAEKRWSEEDEARFEAEAKAIIASCQPGYRKALRVIWKIFGKAALGSACSAVPGVGELSCVSVASRYVADLVGRKI